MKKNNKFVEAIKKEFPQYIDTYLGEHTNINTTPNGLLDKLNEQIECAEMDMKLDYLDELNNIRDFVWDWLKI